MVSCIKVNDTIHLFGISKPPKTLKERNFVLMLTQSNHDRSFLLFKIVRGAKERGFVALFSSAPRKTRVVMRQSLALGTTSGQGQNTSPESNFLNSFVQNNIKPTDF